MANPNKPIPAYTIVPGGALQFIDYEVDLSITPDRRSIADSQKFFHVRQSQDAFQDPSLDRTVLVPLEEASDDWGSHFKDRIMGERLPMHYSVKYLSAFKAFANTWLPFPLFAHQGQTFDRTPIFSNGPTDWVRAWLTPPDDPDSLVWRLTLVFDPVVTDVSKEEPQEAKGSIYHTLRPADVSAGTSFSLAWHERDNSWFVDRLEWVKKGLRNIWEGYRRLWPRERLSQVEDGSPSYVYLDPQVLGQTDVPRTEYLALYEALLEAIHLTDAMYTQNNPPVFSTPIRVLNPENETPTQVDLVVDIGNSRITGVLVETQPEGETRLNNCYPLIMRDISAPARTYSEPFDTSVEFMEPWFGPADWSFSPDSRGKHNTFRWPSTVRVGEEAKRLSFNAREELGPTGMSSPKRYLWDTRARKDVHWYFNNSMDYHGTGREAPAVAFGSFVLNINPLGIPLTAFRDPSNPKGSIDNTRPDLGRVTLPEPIQRYVGPDDDIGAYMASYSRSSLMMFLISELIAQALACINSPMKRVGLPNSNRARRLRRIILTIPTAMPLAEQNILKCWAKLAVEAVWYSMDWWHDFFERRAISDFRSSPDIRCDWYESTCTQMVWLFNELNKKYQNNGYDLFKLLGKPREVTVKDREGEDVTSVEDTIRMASIDIGGGTTDISIITYHMLEPKSATPFIIPHQDFRDGFNVAGDDIMREIVRKVVNKALEDAAVEHGVRDVQNIFTRLFQDTVEMGTDVNLVHTQLLRSQFVAHVSVPLALNILKRYEETDLAGDDLEAVISIREVLGVPADREKGEGYLANILGYVEQRLQNAGWRDFSLLDFTFKVNMREVDICVIRVIEQILVDLGEIINIYDCDVLIMTGRPSRWPAIMRAPYERSFLPIDRIVHMHKYRVSPDYPFISHGHIEDPKTSVVLGAIVCSLAEVGLSGVTIDTATFIPQPINRYIGMLDERGRLSNAAANVWFTNTEVHTGKEVANATKSILFNANAAVGFRQLECDRWTTTRLYSLEFRDSQAMAASLGHLPYTVELQFDMKEAQDQENWAKGGVGQLLQRTEGTLRVLAVSGRDGRQVSGSPVQVRLQTLRSVDGYWLDTGDLRPL
ncbi:MAG: virulence factor SrfB [Deltaproteobacteria bacterium]|jgi:hypothetical protein|nr:virulence factor SrfB [Deltaproteobacteria bacterium]